MTEQARVAPRIRGGAAVRSLFLVLGLFLFALGIVLLLESGLGLSPWDVLNQGVSEHTPLSFGAANVAIAAGVVAIAWRLGARIGPGTLANAVGIGVFVDLLLRAQAVSDLSDAGLVGRAALLGGGIALIGLATALYIGAGMGAGARDSLMLVLAQRTSNRVGVVRAALEVAVTVVGFTLGGTVGIGTIAFALAIGPTVEAAFSLLARSPLAVSLSRERASTAPEVSGVTDAGRTTQS